MADKDWALGTKLCIYCDTRLAPLELTNYGDCCHKCIGSKSGNNLEGTGMIYVASPYTHSSKKVMIARHDAAEAFVVDLLRQGLTVFSPIVHCHHLTIKHSLPVDFEFWQNYCLAMLGKADSLWVLQLDGWHESVGVQAEIAFSKHRNIPVVHEIDVSAFVSEEY